MIKRKLTICKVLKNSGKVLERVDQTLQNYSRMKYFAFCGICLMIITANCSSEQQEPFSGLPGGHEGPSETAGPPIDPESWHIVPGNILDENDVWGNRVNPRTTFKIPGGMGLMYTSHPGVERMQDLEWREEQERLGVVRAGAGSFAFTNDLVNWYDFPGNPVVNKVQNAWQSPHRAALRDLLYDPVSDQWVVYFSDAGGDYPGIRAVGAAYSKDLINWEYMDRPMITINDYASWVPERIVATDQELLEGGRVYHEWAIYHHGKYYFSLNGSTRTGEGRTYSSILLVSDSPTGPFERIKDVEEDYQPPGANKPVYWEGKWYSIFTGNWDGQPGFGLAWSDKLTGPYQENPHNPIIAVESIQRSHPYLFNYEGLWGVLFSRGGDATVTLPLRMAIANIHPSLLQFDRNNHEHDE